MDKIQIYLIKCPICANLIRENENIKIYQSKINKSIYKLYHCFNCGLEFYSPLRMELKLYEKNNFDFYYRQYSNLNYLQNHHKLFFNQFNNLKYEGNLLDVGCGNGSV